MIRRIQLSLLLAVIAIAAKAQFHGTVIDAGTGEPIPYAAAKYVGTSLGQSTDFDGNFTIPIYDNYNKLEITCLGYKPVTVTVNKSKTEIYSTIKMYSDDILLGEVVVKKSKIHYKRKNNPAVDLMRKVIANKKLSDIKLKDYYHFDKYEKHTFAYNDVEKSNLAEVCPETGKLIIPIMVDETQSEENYRKNPQAVKTTIHAKRADGFQNMLSSGDMLTAFVKDIFTDVDIYKDNVRILQHPFISPISTSEAIGFYHYYIQDTIQVDGEQCIDVVFMPNNTQDFGFSGHLFITDDAKNQIKRAVLNIPNKSGVNFVDNLLVIQDFMTLPGGERVLKTDDMIVEISGFYGAINMQCQRYTSYSNYDFSPILDKKAFKSLLIDKVMPDAEFKDSTYWASIRPIKLTETESNLGRSVDKINDDLGGFWKFLLKAVVENSIELTPSPNKLDFIPLNSIISHNDIDGMRYQIPLQTTGNLSHHLFARGYAAYGAKDEKMKYKAELEYSFNKKKYMAHEFPRRSITVSYMYDDMSPVDKYSGTTKDNVYSSFKASKVDQMMYVNDWKAKFQYETDNYMTFSLTADNAKLTPAGKLNYMPVNGQGMTLLPYIRTTDLKFGFRYSPRETFINSKQQRLPINNDALILTVEHTLGLDGPLGGQYKYNMTEASVFKKFWLPAALGYVETTVKGGYQWNKVPFPMLFTPQSNLSYFTQFDNGQSFMMLRNMEFLNDKYVAFHFNWNLDGKILNRVPLLKKLKLREHIGFKMLYGGLSDKNNPYLAQNANDNTLMYFPTRDGHQTSFSMGKKPYMEMSVGIGNIFKVLTIQYIRRLNHYDVGDIYGGDKLKKNGVRFALDFKF
ncbi:MAG: carboxypeptidase-like regulatory domain-containing protein [Prevotellaceae bacterium]|nr:carboxypeptidase-like regulatory domain-containing protein [Candidatus Minthosoma equi]